MKLIKLECSNCGANLEVNEELKNIFCNYCGQNYVLDDEIIKVEHILDTNKNDIDNAITYLNDFKDYHKAYQFFLELSKNNASNSVVWEGLLRAYTYDFSDDFNNINFETVKDYFDKFMVLEKNKKKKVKLKELFKNYSIKYNNYLKELDTEKQNERQIWSIVIIIISLILCIGTIGSRNQQKQILQNMEPSFSYILESDKTTINVNENIQFYPVYTNTYTDDYSIRWFIKDNYSNDEGIISSDGVFSSKQHGEYEVCSEINNIEKCRIVYVKKPCQDKYVFKFDGASSVTYKVADKGDVCPGTYKIKISRIDDRSSFVTIHHGYLDWEYLGIGYDSDWLKFAVKDGDSIEVDSGITKIELKKIN